eukprot:670983-Amphidinium_carterae.1
MYLDSSSVSFLGSGVRSWRYSTAHAFQNMDRLTGEPLLARVCSEDPSLHISATHIDMNDRMKQYRSPASRDLLADPALRCPFTSGQLDQELNDCSPKKKDKNQNEVDT